METSVNKHRFGGRRKTAAVLACVLAAAIMLGGTYAWMSLDQQGLNTASGEPGAAGGRLHDDYEKFVDDESSQDYKVWAQGVTANKDIYIENYEDPMTGRNLFVRVKLYEFMETGPGTKQGPYLADGVTPNSAYMPTPLITGTDREDLDTWIPVSSSNGASNRFRSIFTWTRGGSKTFMPTFNMNNHSNETDISGAAIDPQFPLNVTLYPDEAGLHDYWTSVPPFTEDERYWDDSILPNGGEAIRQNMTHVAKPTLNALILTMDQWIAAGKQLDNFWVLDTDGWCYWANPLAGGDATGLLLDSITLIGEPDDEWYYGIHVKSEMATGNDWSIAFYGADSSEWPSDNAAELLSLLTGYKVENFMFTIDTRMTDTLFATNDTPDTNYAHFAGTATEFYIPTSGYPYNTYYDWMIDWGDGTVESHSGNGVQNSPGIRHEYALPGEYQISIRPAGMAIPGWFTAFGFEPSNTSTNDFANSPENMNMLKSIDTPFSNHMKSDFRFTFWGCKNAIAIPGDLFSNIDTYGRTDLSYLFYGTFDSFAHNSTDATIPAGLFDSLDTSSAINVAGMFRATFLRSATNSTTGAIPSNLFASIDVGNATNTSHMFHTTFMQYATESTVGTIPAGLFDSIDTSNVTNVLGMFHGTFTEFARNSATATIPAGLFDSINTSNALYIQNMFYTTFREYARYSTVATIPAGLFNSIHTNNADDLSQMFYYTFQRYGESSTIGTIPAGLFASIDTSNATNLQGMFLSTFPYFASNSPTATIPAGLFDSIDTSNATNTRWLYQLTFYSYATSSTEATIPANLFDKVDLENATTMAEMFRSTFGYYATSSTNTTDINSIWGAANFRGKVTASNAGGDNGVYGGDIGMFYFTFSYMPSLTGSAQTFIDGKLGVGMVPLMRTNAFVGTGVTDITTIHTNWK